MCMYFSKEWLLLDYLKISLLTFFHNTFRVALLKKVLYVYEFPPYFSWLWMVLLYSCQDLTVKSYHPL